MKANAGNERKFLDLNACLFTYLFTFVFSSGKIVSFFSLSCQKHFIHHSGHQGTKLDCNNFSSSWITLVLSEMLQGWQKTRGGFLRKKWPPSFCKATPTSSFLPSPWDVGSMPRDAGMAHMVDGAASACLASLNGEGMPCHSSCSSCLLLYPVCELLTLIAPSPARAPLPLPNSKTVSCFLESGSMRASC